MKKSMKFTSVIAAALFAVSPVVATVTSSNVSATTMAEAEKFPTVAQTINDFKDYFFKQLTVVDASNGQTIGQEPGKMFTGSLDDERMQYRDFNMLTNFGPDHKVFVGNYHGSAKVIYGGLQPSATARKVKLYTMDNVLVGEGTMAANSDEMHGYVNFTVTMNADGTPTTPVYQGALTTKKSAKKSAKKHIKKSHKKSTKRTKKSRRAHKKAKKHSRRR